MSALSGCRDVTGWRGEKWGKNRGREGKAERRHNQVRGGDTRAGRGGGEVWFCTGAGVLVVTWAVTAGRRWKRGPTGWRQMRGGGGYEGSQRRRKKAWFLFLFTTEECPLREWDVSPPPPAAAPLGPNWFLWEHWAPCLNDPQPPSPRLVGVSQHTRKVKTVAGGFICMFSWETSQLTAAVSKNILNAIRRNDRSPCGERFYIRFYNELFSISIIPQIIVVITRLVY